MLQVDLHIWALACLITFYGCMPSRCSHAMLAVCGMAFSITAEKNHVNMNAVCQPAQGADLIPLLFCIDLDCKSLQI